MKITHPLIPGLLIAALAVPGMAMAQSTRQVPPRPQLSDMDSNHDGKVTLREFDAAIAAGPGHQGGQAGHGKAPQTKSRTPPPPPSGDRQGDGQGRTPQPPKAADLDKNHDGIISQREFDAFIASMPAPPARK